MHVHVHCGNGEAKFWLEPDIRLVKNYGFYRQYNVAKSNRSLRHIAMSSNPPGKPASAVEITNISNHGVWLLAHDKELFMAYQDFPWFRDVPVGKILNVEEPSPNHFYRSDLGVDPAPDIIEHPERIPMKAQ